MTTLSTGWTLTLYYVRAKVLEVFAIICNLLNRNYVCNNLNTFSYQQKMKCLSCEI